MSSLIDTFVSSSTYNTLPLISEVNTAPDDRSQDLQEIRHLLTKHNVPKGVSVRLIHKHFDTTEGEIMAFERKPVPGYGAVQIMRPIMAPEEHELKGLHYFVNDSGSLQAYEYGNQEVPDMSGLEPFLAEFCSLVAEKGLERVFGLKLQVEDESENQTGWTEYEFHAKRGTITFPDGMPMPDGESDFSVTTEWKAIIKEFGPKTCKHSTTCKHGDKTCKHCSHCQRHEAHDGIQEEGLYLGGQHLLPGTPVHAVVSGLVSSF